MYIYVYRQIVLLFPAVSSLYVFCLSYVRLGTCLGLLLLPTISTFVPLNRKARKSLVDKKTLELGVASVVQAVEGCTLYYTVHGSTSWL